MTTAALSPLYASLYDRLDGLAGLGSAHFGVAPADAAQPYAVIVSDTETEALFFADRDGAPSDATVTVNVWDDSKADALTAYTAIVASLRNTPLAVTGFGLLLARLDAGFSVSDPTGGTNAPMYGQAARFRFILNAG